MRLMLSQNTAKKVSLVLGVASVAASAGNVAVKAGPALQTLNNLTNSAEFTINNTYGQSFSVDGVVASDIQPFRFATAVGTGDLAAFNAQTATLITGFVGSGAINGSLKPVSSVSAFASIVATAGGVSVLAALSGITIAGATGTQSLGASISSTLFGPSSVKATTSFTNQLINDLSAF